MDTPGRSWFLTNADLSAAANKYTFYKPSRTAIGRLAVGEHVKLIFEFTSDDPEATEAERMWVFVDEIIAPGKFRGRLDNDPYYIKDLKSGDVIEFESCHIIQTPHDPEDNPVSKHRASCTVTSRILHDGAPVRVVLREAPQQDDDSGWCIFAGDESDEYYEDGDNVHYVSLGAVLARDDSFVGVLDAPVGAQFVLDEETGQFLPLIED